MADSERQKLIERARELNTRHLDADEITKRLSEVCAEYLIEARVDVDRFLRHEDWNVRWHALHVVWRGLGATDGIDATIDILMYDADEDVRSRAAHFLYEAGRGTAKEGRVIEVLRRVEEELKKIPRHPKTSVALRTAAWLEFSANLANRSRAGCPIQAKLEWGF